MAKSRSSKSKSKSKSSRKSTREKSLLNSTGSFSTNPHASSTSKTAGVDLLAEASTQLHERSSASAALPLITAHLSIHPNSPPALDLLGEIHIELGDTSAAFSAFSKSASLDPDGNPEPAGSGPEKFLWLAQLSSADAAVSYYEQGITIIKRWLAAATTNTTTTTTPPPADRGLESKLVSALCGLAEIYMSDLCMEPDAESRCEKYVTEALLALPESAEALQTLASMRISQQRLDDAVAALERAFESWKGLEIGDARIPPYANRVNLSKLLIETAQYETALEVLEVLQMEDDQLPDLWYLGGWCLFLLGEGEKEKGGEWEESWESAKEWLGNCLTVGPLTDPTVLVALVRWWTNMR